MRTGRPRTFDTDEALQTAQNAFFELGYEGASLSILTKAMGINSPSLYRAFGDKEQLFIAVLNRYYTPRFELTKSILFEPGKSTLDAFILLIENIVDASVTCDVKQGCLLVNSSIYMGQRYPALESKLHQLHDKHESLYYERLVLGVKAEDIVPTVDCGKVARFLTSTLNGLSIQVRMKKQPTEITDIGDEVIKYLTYTLTKPLLGSINRPSHYPGIGQAN
jgi:AcrR family transcriptional regulator